MDRRARACAQIFDPIQDHGALWNNRGFGLVKIEGLIVGGAFKRTLYDTIGHKEYVKYLSKNGNMKKIHSNMKSRGKHLQKQGKQQDTI